MVWREALAEGCGACEKEYMDYKLNILHREKFIFMLKQDS
jgi:hypothetical protein